MHPMSGSCDIKSADSALYNNTFFKVYDLYLLCGIIEFWVLQSKYIVPHSGYTTQTPQKTVVQLLHGINFDKLNCGNIMQHLP